MSLLARKADILLCDLDAFYASVEQRERPEYSGKPVIVGGEREARGVVAACSYEARRFGVHSAMPMSVALQLCPLAVVLPVNMQLYRRVSARVMEILGRYTPDLEIVSIDEAYLAVSSGSGLQTAAQIRSSVRRELNLPISIGVSINKLLAKIACELAKPDGTKELWPESVRAVLWPMAVRILPGIGPATEKKLTACGIKTVGDLAGYPTASLQNILGNTAANLRRYAQGLDDRQLELEHTVKSISEEVTFPVDIASPEYVEAALLELTEEASYRLRSSKMYAKTVSLKLRFSDFKTITRAVTLPEATDQDSVIYRVVRELFLGHCARPPWRLVGIRLSGIQGCKQLSLLPPDQQDRQGEKVTPVIDRLRDRFGREAIFRAKRLMTTRDIDQ